jgi:guanosine-3',5'-bis(diphosphate) 3'-pyrophosphohydrolase
MQRHRIEKDVMDSTTVAAAREFACAAHDAQRYGDLPYSFHLDAVAALLERYGPAHQVVGYLHDVVEDTAVTVDDISRLFGPLVATCVSLLSDGPGASRKERKEAINARLGEVLAASDEAIALVVKVADRLANVRHCVAGGTENREKLERYRREHGEFRAAVYRPGLAEALWQELDALVAA